jgi:DNA-binding NarL/FixJ family response regulator
MPVRIILTDDHPVVTEGIKNILKSDSRFEIIGEFRNGRELLHASQLHSADLLLLDLNMPQIDGLQVLRELQNSNAKKIIISAYKSQKLVDECKQAGASAFIIKTENLSSLKEVIEPVMNGEKFFPDFGVYSNEFDDKFSYMDEFLIKYKLTKREVEIIRMVCNGLTSNDIADKLSLSTFTIQTHRKNIFKKLSLDHSNQMALYEFAAKNGLI